MLVEPPGRVVAGRNRVSNTALAAFNVLQRGVGQLGGVGIRMECSSPYSSADSICIVAARGRITTADTKRSSVFDK